MGLTFWTLSILLISVAQSTDVKDCLAAKDFEHSIKQIQAENAFLREQVKLMKERDIEADIEEIKNRLDSYGEDITALRITQGEHTEKLNQHSDHFATVDNTLIVNAGQLSAHDQTFVQHTAYMEENRNTITSHSQIINDHQALIQANTDGINNNAARIQENLNSIIKNGQDIQYLSDNFNNYLNSRVKFHVETTCCEGSEYWPDNSRLVYKWKHLDTHNALDIGNGQFTVPITGFYGFILSADFKLYDERSEIGYINININDGLARQYMFDSRRDDEIWQTYSIYFAYPLNQGDRVDISTSGDPTFDISRNGAFWMGYLM